MQMNLAYSNEARFTVLQDKTCEVACFAILQLDGARASLLASFS